MVTSANKGPGKLYQRVVRKFGFLRSRNGQILVRKLGSIWVQETNPRRIMARVELSVAIAWVEQWRIIGPSYTATTLFIRPAHSWFAVELSPPQLSDESGLDSIEVELTSGLLPTLPPKSAQSLSVGTFDKLGRADLELSLPLYIVPMILRTNSEPSGSHI
ncbi:hypothetical protein B0H13DRAFT_1875312 [Mycena leptocephala]|nr:hypothetical protein B0H13DRAFT_1875312 [Mycena leptocephala]